MPQSALLKASAAVMAVFGAVLLLAPNALIVLYQAPAMNSPGVYNTMLYGTMLIAFAVLNWASAHAPVAAHAAPVLLGNLVGDVMGLAVTLYLQVTDPVVPRAAWTNVVLFLVFGVLFAQAWLRLRAGRGAVAAGAVAG